MRRCRHAVASTVLATIIACDSSSPTSPDDATHVTGITVTGDEKFTEFNQIHPLVATAQMDKGNARDVTADATWQSSDPSVVAVSSQGEARSVGLGAASVMALYQGHQGALLLSVLPADTETRMVGSYRLAITVSAACGMPGWAQRGEYDASILQLNGLLTLVVRLQSDHTERFEVVLRGTTVTIVFPTEFSYGFYGEKIPVFSEQINATSAFTVEGTASVSLHSTRMSGTLVGEIRAVTVSPGGGARAAVCRAGGEFSLLRR
jgi:hypothetical protein